jgi:hypothetical protein
MWGYFAIFGLVVGGNNRRWNIVGFTCCLIKYVQSERSECGIPYSEFSKVGGNWGRSGFGRRAISCVFFVYMPTGEEPYEVQAKKTKQQPPLHQ